MSWNSTQWLTLLMSLVQRLLSGKKAGDGRIGHDESHERYHFFLELIAVGLATFLGFCGAAALFLWLLTL